MDKFGRSAHSNNTTRKPTQIIQSSLPLTPQGAYDIENHRLSNLMGPKDEHDAVTKAYIDLIRDNIIKKEIPTINTFQQAQTVANVETKIGNLKKDFSASLANMSKQHETLAARVNVLAVEDSNLQSYVDSKIANIWEEIRNSLARLKVIEEELSLARRKK